MKNIIVSKKFKNYFETLIPEGFQAPLLWRGVGARFKNVSP